MKKTKKELFHFADDGNSCVITDPETPRHWYNYLWNEDRYLTQVSQMGHGKSYYLDEQSNMCMINRDDTKYVYLRDDETNTSWNIGEGPMNIEVDDYSCTHNIGYSKISSKKDGVEASWRVFIPKRGFHEVWTLHVKNNSGRTRKLSMFSAVSFQLEGFQYPRYYEMYRCMTTNFDQELNGIYCGSAHPFAPHEHYNGFLASSEPVFAYDGNLAKFCGTTNTLTLPDASACGLFVNPDVVAKGMDCTNSEASLFILGGVLQHKFVLEPGEDREIQVIFGICSCAEEARSVVKTYRDKAVVEDIFSQAVAYNYEKISSLSIRTPDAKVNAIMNNWVKKQVDFCIVGKKGVRDNLQIAVGLLNYRQVKAKEEIIECLSHQFRDGHAVLTWYPYDDTRYSDQPFWIIWAVCELIKETGDFSILEQNVAWQDGGSATVLDHVKAAVERLIVDKGKNGLVKIYFADWNDALNITDDSEAESVMLSHQFALALRELKQLMLHAGDIAYADYVSKQYNILKSAINDHAWDGSWYARALSDKGNVGSIESKGSKIYVNAQTWAILADVVPADRASRVVESVDAMEHDFGFPLNLPAYQEYDPHVGRMSGMLPGLFENGGVYCHATGFKVLMDCKLGRGTKAVETMKKIMPDNALNPSTQSGAEPYVFTNCYSTNPGYYGKSYQSWTTGTSSWCLMGVYEGIMGIKRDYEGLRIQPCFPAKWEGAEATRHFRDADYHVVITNPNHVDGGIADVYVDDRLCENNILPDFKDGKWHEVRVIMRAQ